MGCGVCLLKCWIIFFNVLLLIIGLILTAFGIFLKVGAKSFIDQYSQPVSAGISLMKSIYFSSSNSTSSGPVASINLDSFIDPVATVLIIFGVLLAVLSFLAACGACCNSTCLLALYTTLLGLIILAEAIIAAVVLSGGLNSYIQTECKKTLVDYRNIDVYDFHNMLWNVAMIEFKCCGVTDHGDFDSVPWVKLVYVDNAHDPVNLTTPIACCKFDGDFPNGKTVTFSTSSQQQSIGCAIHPTNDISNFNTGCWDGVTTYFAPYRPIVVGVVCGIIFVEVLLLIMVIVILCSFDNKNKVSPSE